MGFFPFLYKVIKWELTPFEEMEKYIPAQGKIYDEPRMNFKLQ